MTTWNYRIMRHEYGEYAVHEVYYDDDGVVKNWSIEPIGVVSDTEEGMLEILSRMRESGSKATLDYKTGKPVA